MWDCKETTTFVKECGKIIECKKKGTPNFKYIQGILLEKSKEHKNLKKYVKDGASKIRESVRKASKTCKSVRKCPKLEVVMNLNSFNNVEVY